MAIVGLAPSRSEAPSDWERWGLAWDADALRYERAFEMHEEHSDMPKDYLERLSYFPKLYTQDNYPLEEVAKTVGGYFESSVAYMLALAIHEGYDEIGLWGIDMKAGEEYGYQKANMEYLIGLARGKGIKVLIHPSSPLCSFSGSFGYSTRYGKH